MDKWQLDEALYDLMDRVEDGTADSEDREFLYNVMVDLQSLFAELETKQERCNRMLMNS